MFQTFLYSKALFKGKLDTQRALQGHLGTGALQEHSGIWIPKALGHLGIRGTRALEGHLSTQVLGHSKQFGTWALRNLGNWTLGHSRMGHSRHFI